MGKTDHDIQMLHEQQCQYWDEDIAYWRECQPVTAALAEAVEPLPSLTLGMDTAMIDGRRVLINPVHNAQLNHQDRRFLFTHLLWHCALGHVWAEWPDDIHRWHVACDHEVNALLLMLGIDLNAHAVLFPGLLGREVHEVYALLERHPLLAYEQPPDPCPGASLPELGALPAPEDAALWQAHLLKVVWRYLGTQWLPTTVATVLLQRAATQLKTARIW